MLVLDQHHPIHYLTTLKSENNKKYTRAGVTSSLNLSIGHYAGGMKREP